MEITILRLMPKNLFRYHPLHPIRSLNNLLTPPVKAGRAKIIKIFISQIKLGSKLGDYHKNVVQITKIKLSNSKN